MPARVATFPLPHRHGPRILWPAFGWAFLAALVAVILRKAQQPSLPGMSEQWLLSHQRESYRDEN